MTLAVDRNFNYLWYMYHSGTKRGNYKAFMLAFEMNLMVALKQITEEERENIAKMCSSEDEDNLYMGLLAIDNFRKQRIKQHGEWKDYGKDASSEFREAVSKYPTLIVRGEKLDKL
jgi:ribosome recycling factor